MSNNRFLTFQLRLIYIPPVDFLLTIEKRLFIFQVLLCFLLVFSTFASRFKGKYPENGL